MPNQPLTANECVRLGYPIPEGADKINIWRLTGDGTTEVEIRTLVQGTEKSAVNLLDDSLNQ